jgi:hypothetical protein
MEVDATGKWTARALGSAERLQPGLLGRRAFKTPPPPKRSSTPPHHRTLPPEELEPLLPLHISLTRNKQIAALENYG